MRQILVLIYTLLSFVTFGQQNQTVDLKWKIDKNEPLSYATIMSEIDTSTLEINFGNIFKFDPDSSDYDSNKGQEFFQKFRQAYNNLDYQTKLFARQDSIIDIVMTTRPKTKAEKNEIDSTVSKETSILEMMHSINKGVMLRGSVYETGGIHSFWIKNDQKNLIAILFELPSTKVGIGDSWPIEINLIANDQNFECDSSYKVNEVTLVDIKKLRGESIALLEYNIVEYVHGYFRSPFLQGKEGKGKETMMKFKLKALAEFSVNRGRWLNYDGIMELEANGFMNANTKTRYKLIQE